MMRWHVAGLAVMLLALAVPTYASHASQPVFQADSKGDFTYTEGWDTKAGGYFYCEATSDNGDYAGVTLEPMEIAEVTFRAKANSDGTSSILETYFTLANVGVSTGSKYAAREESVRLEMKENGDSWTATLEEERGGASKWLGSTILPGANSDLTVRLFVDLQNDKVELRASTGNPLLSEDLTSKAGDRIYAQWYKCGGTNGVYPAATHILQYGPTHRSTQIVRYEQDRPPSRPQILGQDPFAPAAGQDTTVTASSNDDHGSPYLALHYKVDGSIFAKASMSGNPKTATIPGQANGAKVVYYVEAIDSLGQSNATTAHTYTVGTGQGTTDTGEAPQDPNNPNLRGSGGTLGSSGAGAAPLIFLAVGLGVAFLLRYIGAEKRVAILVALGGLVLAAGAYVYATHAEAIQAVPNLVWVLAGGAAAVGFLQRRRARRNLL